MMFHRLGLILNRESRRGIALPKTPPPLLLKKERGHRSKTLRGVRLIHKSQRGFTLVELMLAITITGVITGGITMTLLQVLDANARTSNHMIAVRQVQNAGYWISHDAQMSQIVALTPAPDPDGFPLTLTWTDWDSSDEHQVVYSLLEDNKLQREHYTNREPSSAPDATTIVAEYIDSDQTSCVWDGAGKLTFTVTATVEEQSETRIYEVVPRPGS